MKVAKQTLVALLICTFFNASFSLAQSSPYQPLNRELTKLEEK
jgi:hypothetical protein